MINVDVALKSILKGIKTLEAERIKLTDSLERVLAEDIYADADIPGFDNSAMDGFALKAADIRGASVNNPVFLEVIGNLKAGDVFAKVIKAKQAVRIMTGAALPKGADSVVMVEDTKKIRHCEEPQATRQSQNGIASPAIRRVRNDTIGILKEIKKGENVRRVGEDIKRGELVLRRGLLLKPAHIGILASLGRAEIEVARKPKVAVLATGDELVDVEEKLKPGKIRSSNSYTLFNQILECGAIARSLGIVKDEPLKLEAKIRRGLDCDLIITSGGVSVGDYDLVKDILAKMGTDIHFWKVAMRPGKPLVFGTIKEIPVFGLPGNPVSSMVSFEVFVKPAILKMLGQREESGKEVEAVLESDIEKKKGLSYFIRANTRWQQGKFRTDITGPQGSGILKSMGLANSLIVLAGDDIYVKKGRMVKVRFLN